MQKMNSAMLSDKNPSLSISPHELCKIQTEEISPAHPQHMQDSNFMQFGVTTENQCILPVAGSLQSASSRPLRLYT